jgi:S-adenosylmethionine synthetase
MSHYFFTSEAVSEGHPDKIADQISDAILDNFLVFDEHSKVACETMVTTNKVIVAGEIKSQSEIDIEKIIRATLKDIGYTKRKYNFEAKSCEIINCLHQQSENITRGVEKNNPAWQGAGDQGIMFGYATNETPSFMPLPLFLANLFLVELSKIRKAGKQMTYLRPDAKSQVTVKYNINHKAVEIETVVLSAQHDEFILPSHKNKAEIKKAESEMLSKIEIDVKKILVPKVLKNLSKELRPLLSPNTKYLINPTGVFVIGGPDGDAGLTGRKIIVDTYGGRGSHGGGSFSGKDPSKVDRSGAYAARHLAKNLVAGGYCDKVLIQISYAIGIAKPCSVFIDTYNTNKSKLSDEKIARRIFDNFDLTPFGIEKRLKLRNPIFLETAAYGHFGREPEIVTKTFINSQNKKKNIKVKLFSWEEIDLLNDLDTILNPKFDLQYKLESIFLYPKNEKSTYNIGKHNRLLQNKFKKNLRKYNDDELVASFNKEVGNRGFVSARGFFLYELANELNRRNWDWSIIKNESGGFHLGLGNKIYLKNNKLFLIEDQ